jgi:hypothetical protein
MLDAVGGRVNRTALTGGERFGSQAIEKATQERTDIAASGNRGKKVDAAQTMDPRQGLKQSEIKSGAANSAARKRQPGDIFTSLAVLDRIGGHRVRVGWVLVYLFPARADCRGFIGTEFIGITFGLRS